MKVLLFGAGAVGQVYGDHLQRGGAEVSFFVREKYAEECREGFTLYPLNRGRQPAPVDFKARSILSSYDEVAAETWDQVWICTSSTAIRAGWLDEFLAVCGEASIVALQPGLVDRAFYLERLPASRLVSGVIAFIAFQTPLPGRTRPRPGIAVYHPPFSASPFSGPKEALGSIVKILRAGGCPAKTHPAVDRWSAVPSAIMMPHLVALEACDWSFTKLTRSPLFALAGRASRQALGVVAKHQERRPILRRHLVRPTTMRLVTGLGPWLMPFDLELYLKYHFTKVGDQTRAMMQRYVDIGGGDCPTGAIAELLAAAFGALSSEGNDP